MGGTLVAGMAVKMVDLRVVWMVFRWVDEMAASMA
jgi:hypothetical protein